MGEQSHADMGTGGRNKIGAMSMAMAHLKVHAKVATSPATWRMSNILQIENGKLQNYAQKPKA